jgi:transcriptional regulator with XRE-family HTH domain
MTPTNADLGAAVRRLRHERRQTIEALAFEADMHPTYLSGIERGVRNPTWEKITGLARALDVSLVKVVKAAEEEAAIALIVQDARARLAAADAS